MSATDPIRIHIAKHGWFQTTAYRFDLLIERYLPASPQGLRQQIEERSPEIDYSDVHTVTECLMILAELDGYATN
jgi:hypothetical protein